MECLQFWEEEKVEPMGMWASRWMARPESCGTTTLLRCRDGRAPGRLGRFRSRWFHSVLLLLLIRQGRACSRSNGAIDFVGSFLAVLVHGPLHGSFFAEEPPTV